MSSMSKNSAPGMCSARYSALASRLAVGRCMEPSRTTRSGASRCEASQSVSTSHLRVVDALHARVVPPIAQANETRMRRFMLALLLDLGDDDRADLAGALDVRAAAGLQVDGAVLADDDEAHLARCPSAASPPWCAPSCGLASSSASVIQRSVTGWSAAISALRSAVSLSLSTAEASSMSKSSRPSSAIDLAAGDGELHQRAQQVQAGVHAHEPWRVSQSSTARTVWPGAGRAAPSAGDVHDGGLVRVVDGGGDGAGAAALDLERALVAGLAAGRRIEHGAVEHDAAALVDGRARAPCSRAGRHRRGRAARSCAQRLRRRSTNIFGSGAALGDEPVRHRQVLRPQELRIEQLGLVARAVVAEHRDDGVAGTQLLGQPDGAGDVDARSSRRGTGLPPAAAGSRWRPTPRPGSDRRDRPRRLRCSW